jgi:hypothetical protein
MTATCTAPVPFPTLVDYWFGDLAPTEEERVDEHLFGCARCSGQLGSLTRLGAGVRSAFLGGAVPAVITPELLRAMKQQGLRLREYPVAPGGSVHCTISTSDDGVVSRLTAPLAGVTRLDLVVVNEPGRGRLSDIPFEPSLSEVLFCPSAAGLKQAPAHTQILRLLAVEPGGERPIGDYTFVHTPS